MSPSHAAVANGTGNGGMTAHGQTNAYLERKDVHRGNIMVMIAGLKDLLKHKHRKVGRRKRKQVIEHEHAAQLERLFFGTDFTDEEQLACMRGTGWIPSHVYAQVEMNLHRILGNPQKTAEFIPRPAYRYNFGVPFGWKLHLIRAMLSPTASMVGPSLGFSEILPMMSPELQSNKLEDLYQIGVYHAIMRTTPVRIRGTILRHPHTDISRGFFYEGFILSQTLFFMDEVGTYRRLVVDYSIFEEVNKWRDFMLPGYHLKDDGDKLYLCLETGGTVQRQLIAQQCRLYREDTKDGVFYTQTDPSSERAIADDFVVGWKVVKDIHVTQASGETWRLLQGGTVFSAEAGCGLTRYDFEPKTARARSVFKMYHNLYTRPAIPVSLALASLGTVGGIALAAATETLNLWQFGPLAGLVAAGVVGIPMGFTALTKVGANLRTDVVRRQQDDRHRQWLREQGRDLERESDRRKSELYPDQETAAKIETGDISSLVYDNATIMGVDLEGYTGLGIWFGDQARAEILDEMVRQFGPKLGPKMAKHRGAVLGNIRLA